MNEPLSYFVKYKEAVDNTTIDVGSQLLLNEINNTINVIENNNNSDTELLHKQQAVIEQELKKFNSLLTNTKQSIETTLRSKELLYLRKSYELYEMEMNADGDIDYIIERFSKHPLIIDKSIKKRLLHTISEYCTWEYPGLVIRPGLCDLIEPMVSLDPLYIVDENIKLLECVKSKWNETYQSRLRYGIINDNCEKIFKYIPEQQLGLVFTADFFNFKPLEVIKKYINEIFNILRPGGILIFTYNNCNLANAVRNFEHFLYSYTPGTLVMPMIELIGFEVLNTFNDPNSNTNWVTVKKPGTLTTQRGGQCLGKINI